MQSPISINHAINFRNPHQKYTDFPRNEQMKFYPKLFAELKSALDMLEQEVISPGLGQVMKKIRKNLGVSKY